MKKIIFLDIDGVLNTEKHNISLKKQKKSSDKYGLLFDPNTIKHLETIIESTHADIVIMSSWKFLGLDSIQEMWKSRNLPGKVIDITPSNVSDDFLLNNDLEDIDLANLYLKGVEIESWLSKFSKNIKYVIIDDENVVLNSQLASFIKTNPYDGLTEELSKKAISILSK